MLAAATDQVYWGRTRILYEYRFAERKTLAITVHPDLRVTVVATLDADLEAIRNKVRKRGSWIRKQWREFQLYLPQQPPRRYVNGESHRYLGRQYRLRAEVGEKNSVKCQRGYFIVILKQEPTPELVERYLDSWYRKRAKVIFEERLDVCCKRAAREGIIRPPFRICHMEKRWGSCTDRGGITLNTELIEAPKECIDYVIMHELCHLKEAHHGPRFWGLLERVMPDYEERRLRLNIVATQ